MESTFEFLNVNILKTAKYNRDLKDTQRHAKLLAANFDPNKLGTIEVSLRDGFYNIVDGQNRVLACRLVGHEMVGCKVHHGLTYEQEALLFHDLNKKRFMLKAAESLKGLREGKDPEITRLYAIVGVNGFQIATQCGQNSISAVGALQKVVKRYGMETLDKALDIISKSWNGDQQSLKGDMIEGLSVLIDTYGTDFKKKRAIDRFSTVLPKEIFQIAEIDPRGGMKKLRMARAMLFVYNKALKTKLNDSEIK